MSGEARSPRMRKGLSGIEKERAEVLARHKDEWLRHRVLLDEVMAGGDYEQARLVKTLAETLKIRQDGERRTWGLADRPEPERSEGMEIRWKA